MNENEVAEMLYELIASMKTLTNQIGALIEQNQIFIESVVDMDEEEPNGYLDGGPLNG